MQLPRTTRISIVLAGIFGGEPEDYINKAEELQIYVDDGFKKPYKPLKEQA